MEKDSFSKHAIEGNILSVRFKVAAVIFSKIKLQAQQPVDFSRIQFPVKLSFAMSIKQNTGTNV